MKGKARDELEMLFEQVQKKVGGRRKGHMVTKQKPPSNMRARVAVLTVADEHGNLLFTDKDIIPLGEKNSAALSQIWDLAMTVNRFTDEDIKELEGN